jgi:hypothetical protein
MKHAIAILIMLSSGLPAAQTVSSGRAEAEKVVTRYINAVGGVTAIAGVTSRVTRGTFDNGRGLVEPFVTWVKTPDKLATHVGRKDIGDGGGSGRATDGRVGWDKNFVGTGLRDLTADELVEMKRIADPLRAAHLLTICTTLNVEERREASGAMAQVVQCDLPGSTERWSFNQASGLVDSLDVTSSAGRTTTIRYDDYRRADGLLTPFRERIVVPGATVAYVATTIRYNEAVPENVFEKPTRWSPIHSSLWLVGASVASLQ